MIDRHQYMHATNSSVPFFGIIGFNQEWERKQNVVKRSVLKIIKPVKMCSSTTGNFMRQEICHNYFLSIYLFPMQNQTGRDKTMNKTSLYPMMLLQIYLSLFRLVINVFNNFEGHAWAFCHAYTHWGKKTTFYTEITNNFMFEKCEFCEKWDFQNMNFVKNRTLKMWILWKIRFSKCEFCEILDFQNVNFWINKLIFILNMWKMRVSKCEFLG